MKSPRPLRIAMYDPSGQGGVCHYTYQLAQNLVAIGNTVTVLTSENYELQHLPKDFHLVFLFKKSRIKRVVRCFLASVRWRDFNRKESVPQSGVPVDETLIKRALQRIRLRMLWLKAACMFLWKRPDLVHFQWLVDRDQECFFINLLKLLRFRIVYTIHDVLPQESEARPNFKAIEKIYHKVDAVIVHGKNNKKQLTDTFRLDPAKIHIIPHGSNDLFYVGERSEKSKAKKELGISCAQKVILFFGLIKRYKGLEYLVEAFEETKKRLSNVTLLIVGKIYEADPEGSRFYSHLLHKLRNRTDVVYIPGYIPVEKISSYFYAGDVVVLPYSHTYTSGVLLTAYAAGRPVVVTDTGGLSEVVESGKSGVVVPPKDPEALSQAIEQVLTSPDMETMGLYAKHLAETKYSWRSVAMRTAEMYQSLREKHPTTSAV